MAAGKFAALAAEILPKLHIVQLDKTYWYTSHAYYPANNMVLTSNPEQIAMAHKLQAAATVFNRNLKLRYYCSTPTNKLMMNYLVFTSNSVGCPIDTQTLINHMHNAPKRWILLKSGPMLTVSDVICSELNASSVYFMEFKTKGSLRCHSSDDIHKPSLTKNVTISKSTSELLEFSLTLYVNSSLPQLDIVDYVYQWLCIKIGEANVHKYNKFAVIKTDKTTKNPLSCIERYVSPTQNKVCFLCRLTTEQLPVDYNHLNDINDDWLGNDWICVGCERACWLWEELSGRKQQISKVSSSNVWMQLQQFKRVVEIEKMN